MYHELIINSKGNTEAAYPTGWLYPESAVKSSIGEWPESIFNHDMEDKTI